MEIKSKKPPGRKLVKRMSLRAKWLVSATAGLLLTCYGIVMISQATYLFNTNSPFTRWVLLGIYGLTLFSLGLHVFGMSVMFKSLMRKKKMVKKMLRKRQKKSQDKAVATELKPTIMKVGN